MNGNKSGIVEVGTLIRTWINSKVQLVGVHNPSWTQYMFFIIFQDFNRIVKFYNRIATALVKFENLWLSLWKSRIENGRGGMKTSLLIQHPETKQLMVNADPRYFFCVRFP